MLANLKNRFGGKIAQIDDLLVENKLDELIRSLVEGSYLVLLSK